MATVDIELRKYDKQKTKLVDVKKVKVLLKDAPKPLVLRITSEGKVSRKNTGLYIKESEWDELKRRVNRRHSEHQRLNDALEALVKEAEGLKADVIKVGDKISPGRIMSQVFSTNDFYDAIRKHRDSLDKHNTRKGYDSLITVLQEYAPVLSAGDITPQWLEDYRRYLKTPKKKGEQPTSHNTIIGRFGKIKAVLATVPLKTENPFKEFKVGVYRRADDPEISMEDIQKLVDYVPTNEGERRARATFLFSFYAAGMRSGDVLQLKWSNINKDRIKYDPNKTVDSSQASMSIPLNNVTRSILAELDPSTPTVFDLVAKLGDSEEAAKERGTMQALINRSLKAIAKQIGLNKELSFKMARTAFAQIANESSQRN